MVFVSTAGESGGARIGGAAAFVSTAGESGGARIAGAAVLDIILGERASFLFECDYRPLHVFISLCPFQLSKRFFFAPPPHPTTFSVSQTTLNNVHSAFTAREFQQRKIRVEPCLPACCLAVDVWPPLLAFYCCPSLTRLSIYIDSRHPEQFHDSQALDLCSEDGVRAAQQEGLVSAVHPPELVLHSYAASAPACSRRLSVFNNASRRADVRSRSATTYAERYETQCGAHANINLFKIGFFLKLVTS